MTEITRSPAMIAGEINTIKEQVRTTALSASVEIGRRLLEAKALVPAGEWVRWLKDNVDYSVRTAQNLMALSQEYDGSQAQALSRLSYTQAVMLLALPQEEREEFAETHDLDAMSTRELQKEIQTLKAEKAEMQLTMDELIKSQADSPAEELKQQIAGLEGKLRETRAAVQTAKDVNKAAKETEKELRDKLRETEETARKDKEALEAALKKAPEPIIQQVTPPEVEKELSDLRARASRSQAEEALRANYSVMQSMYERLLENLARLSPIDGELEARFRAAFGKGLRMMADGLAKDKGAAA